MRRLALTLIPLLFLACSREPATPLAPPSFGFENGPLNPGQSFVARTQSSFYWTTVHPSEDLVIRHFDAEHVSFCDGSASPLIIQEQWAPGGPETEVFLALFRDQPVYIYRNSEVPPQDVTPQYCDDLKNKWIYRGLHSYQHHDQDYSMDNPGADAIHSRFIGTLLDPAGHRYGYWEFHMWVGHPDPVGGPSDHPEYLDFYRLVIR
jgi:hypothetical protein